MSQPEVVILPEPAALAAEGARRFVAIARAAHARQGRFSVALAGGATPAGMYRLLADQPYREQVAWQDVIVGLGDERCVPPDSPHSNFRMARETLLDRVPVPAANVFHPPAELPPAEAASAYAGLLRRHFHLRGAARPRFDLILLGMGEDGHTASLFPGMPALRETRRLAVATEVPEYVQPAVPRITLTLPVLNAAANVIFLVAGADKAAAVAAALTGPEPDDPLPARRVRPESGRLVWLLDEPAARELR